MVQDAETHADEDRKAREKVDALNQAEAMIHTVQKTLSDAGDKVEAADKEKIETAIKELEEVIADGDVEQIAAKTNALMEASHKLAEQMYQQQDSGVPPGAEEPATDTSGSAAGGDDVVDAEFEEVKDKPDQ